MNEQAKWWAGPPGEAYTARNRVRWDGRVGFWHRIMGATDARSVYEVGCNAGWNLTAIDYTSAKPPAVYGCDVNPVAVSQARAAGLDVFQGDALEALATFGARPTFDLVFTCGVLIHIPPETLPALMRMIVQTSAQYVLAVEYEAEAETMIRYRDEEERLWKRPYGALYEGMGLRMVDSGAVGKSDGFDDCAYWLLEKQ